MGNLRSQACTLCICGGEGIPGTFASALLETPRYRGGIGVVSMKMVGSERPENDKWPPQSTGPLSVSYISFALLSFSM